MGIPEERYSRIIAKNQREICLLRGFPCAWGKCAFCDYIEDNGRDREAMEALNRQVLSQVTGELGALEIINSGSCFELPEATLDEIAALVHNKNIQQLFAEFKKFLVLQKEYTKLELTEKLTILLSTLITVSYTHLTLPTT